MTEEQKESLERVKIFQLITFELAKWARETNNLQGFERSMALNAGLQLTKGDISAKLALNAVRIYQAAMQKGFKPSSEKMFGNLPSVELTKPSVEPFYNLMTNYTEETSPPKKSMDEAMWDAIKEVTNNRSAFLQWCATKLEEAGEIDALIEVDYSQKNQEIHGYNYSEKQVSLIFLFQYLMANEIIDSKSDVQFLDKLTLLFLIWSKTKPTPRD